MLAIVGCLRRHLCSSENAAGSNQNRGLRKSDPHKEKEERDGPQDSGASLHSVGDVSTTANGQSS